MNSTTFAEGGRQGWTNAPNFRGTIDIITNCFLTLFLCCWSILVVNVPKPGSSSWGLIRRKLLLLLLYAMAPEVILLVALGQWFAARESVELFQKSGYAQWTVRHGFYANMGALHLQPPDWKSFPIDAKQLHYLVVRGHIQFPNIDDNHIRDRNKVDGMLRLITAAQTIWFVVNIIGRAIQGLAITVLELSTAAWVLMGMATSICWMSKPADVERSESITMHVHLAQILQDAGDQATGVYYHTPLDFVSREEWIWSKLWSHGLNVLRWARIAPPPAERPANRIQNTVVPQAKGTLISLVYSLLTLAYLGIFVIAWNFSFPTDIEQTLWRAASLAALGSIITLMLLLQTSLLFPSMQWQSARAQLYAEEKSEHIEAGRQKLKISTSLSPSKRNGVITRLIRNLKNNSILRDPALDLPPLLTLTVWIMGAIYCFGRSYIFVADIVELRSLPASAYQTVNWWQFVPHV